MHRQIEAHISIAEIARENTSLGGLGMRLPDRPGHPDVPRVRELQRREQQPGLQGTQRRLLKPGLARSVHPLRGKDLWL